MSAMFVKLLVLIAVFVAVFLFTQLFLSLVWNQRAERTAVNERMRLIRAGVDRGTVAASLLKNAPPVLPLNASIFQRMYVAYHRMVLTAAIRMEANRLLGAMMLGFMGLVVVMLLISFGSRVNLTTGVVQLLVVIAAAIAFGIPFMFISRRANKRRKMMETQFPVSLDIFSRSLRAGHPVASAINIITEEMEDPIGSEFGLVADEIVYGAEMNDALLAMAQRWDLEDIRMFVVSISVQSETGGNLAEILENLSKVIRERASIYMKVRALSSEGRMTGWMLTVLPVLTLISMFLVNPAFYIDVAQDPIFVFGFPSLVLLYATGVYMIRRLTDLKV